jgi:signal transduction histidine kinase
MRRRISWLVAATTSAVVLAFVVPLCLLVLTVAEDRAVSAAQTEAGAVSTVVSAVRDPGALPDAVLRTADDSPAITSVLMPDGSVLGAPADGLGADPDVRRALRGESFTERDGDGARVLRPVDVDDATAVVVTTVGADLLRDGVARAWAALGLLGVLLLSAALVIADRLGRRVSEPVTELAVVAQRLHEGDLDARAVPQGPEETVELAETLNRLADRIVELLVTERAAVGDLSHRLRTPVTALRLDAEQVTDEADAEKLRGHIEALQRTIDAIVRDARRPLRSTIGSASDATAVVAERVSFWSALAEDQGRPVRVALPSRPLVVALDGADLTDLLDVLVDNVFAHTPDDVGFSVGLRLEGDHAVLEVSDDGPGPDPTADPERPGSTGLGLQIVRRTAARVGGRFTLGRTASGGVATRLTLPLAVHHTHH